MDSSAATDGRAWERRRDSVATAKKPNPFARGTRPPLAEALVSRVLTLAALSCRAVAAKIGISKSSVHNIRHNRRGGASRLARDERRALPGESCPKCGAPLTVFPCRTCRPRPGQDAWPKDEGGRRKDEKAAQPRRTKGDPGWGLKAEHQRRLDEIRRQKTRGW